MAFSQEEIRRAQEMANTEEGQQLLGRLQQEKGAEIQSAINSGDKEKLKSVLRSFLSDPEVQRLRNHLGDEKHG